MADLAALTAANLAAAQVDARGRSVEMLLRDGPLRQAIVALRSGSALPEHDSPTGATLQVLVGRVEIAGPTGPAGPAPATTARAGELVPLPHPRHAVHAPEDAVFLLTTASAPAPPA